MSVETAEISDLLFQWNKVSLNDHPENVAFVPNYDFITCLQHYLLLHNLHLDASPNALWFLMTGFLNNIFTSHHVVQRNRLRGGFICHQKQHITLFIVQNPILGKPVNVGNNLRLIVYNFAIETSSNGWPFNKKDLTKKLFAEFPDLSRTAFEEALERTRFIYIQRQNIHQRSNIHRILRDKQPYYVRYRVGNLPIDEEDLRFNIVPLSSNNLEISFDLFQNLPHTLILEHFLPVLEDATPKFLEDQMKYLLRERLQKEQRDISSGEVVRFFQGATMNVEKMFNLFIMARLLPNGRTTTLTIVPRKKHGVVGLHGFPTVYFFHDKIETSNSDMTTVLQTFMKIPHEIVTFEEHYVLVNVQLQKAESLSVHRFLDHSFEWESTIVPTSSGPQSSVGELLISWSRATIGIWTYLHSFSEHLRLLLDGFGNKNVLFNYILGQLTMTLTSNAKSFVLKPFDHQSSQPFCSTFLIKMDKTGILLSIVDGLSDESTADRLNTIGIPETTQLDAIQVEQIKLIIHVRMKNVKSSISMDPNRWTYFDVNLSDNKFVDNFCQIFVYRHSVYSSDLVTGHYLNPIRTSITPVPLLHEYIPETGPLFTDDSVFLATSNVILKDLGQESNTNVQHTAFFRGVLGAKFSVFNPIPENPSILLLTRRDSNVDYWIQTVSYHVDENTHEKMKKDGNAFVKQANEMIAKVPFEERRRSKLTQVALMFESQDVIQCS